MANRRVLVKRRKAVRNIRKITRTMQLIATARFQAAFNRAVATRPYTEKLAELVADLSRAAGDVDHPLLKTNEGVNHSALVVVTGDRGLAGGYHANVLLTNPEMLHHGLLPNHRRWSTFLRRPPSRSQSQITLLRRAPSRRQTTLLHRIRSQRRTTLTLRRPTRGRQQGRTLR